MVSGADDLARPLRPGGDPVSMAAHLREVVRRLRAGSCHQAVTYLTDLYDRSITPRADLACMRGCAHCCVQTVVVTAAEAFAVAAEVRGQAEMAAAVQAAPRRRLGEPRSAWRPCPFLAADQSCAVYAARPLACHAFVSLDLAACIGFFGGTRDAASFTPDDRQQMMLACRVMLCAAHLVTGHGPQPGYELTGAVAAILATPDAEARWHRGESVLRNVPMGPPIPPQFDREIRRVAALAAL